MTIKEQALDSYYDAMREVRMPADDSCKEMARYTGDILVAIERLYTIAYEQGFNDAINLNINET